ncbi:MAG TPA: hypothetical protein VKS82_15515 [Streptosporangiaceae bacterium]|nr:hypothetical protein [Streptosporangiaceae bacterium]
MRRSRFALVGAAAVAVAIAVLATGCGSSSGSPHGSSSPVPAATQLAPPRAICGTAHTAADVPVVMEVEKGSVACQVAMQIQDSYTALVRSGKVPGNGGGAPVKVDGWTCQGADTTTAVQNGEASACTKNGTEIVAVLKLGNSSGSTSGG